MSEKHIGEVVQVTGPVLDIRFPEGELPALLNAIEIDNHGEKLVVEVAAADGRQHGSLHCHEVHRRTCPRNESSRYGRSDRRSGRRGVLRPRVQPAR